MAEPFISHDPVRREPWKGHEHKAAVRSAIRYAREYGRDLRIWALDRYEDTVYAEVHSADWDAFFAQQEGEAHGA